MKKAKKAKKKHDPPKSELLEPAAVSPPDVPAAFEVTSVLPPALPGTSPGSITVTFTGDPGDPTSDPPVINYRGRDFPKGSPVVVDDKRWIEKHGDRVRSNRHFKVEG